MIQLPPAQGHTVRNHRVAFVFARFLVLRGAEFTPISHQIHTGIRTEIAPITWRVAVLAWTFGSLPG